MFKKAERNLGILGRLNLLNFADHAGLKSLNVVSYRTCKGKADGITDFVKLLIVPRIFLFSVESGIDHSYPNSFTARKGVRNGRIVDQGSNGSEAIFETVCRRVDLFAAKASRASVGFEFKRFS
jgi:hypothetical protein